MRELVFFLFAAMVLGSPQQITITSANKATATLPASPPYSTLATFHIDWRVTIPASVVTSPGWNGYNQTQWAINPGLPGYSARLYGLPYGLPPYTGGFTFLINSFQDTPGSQFSCPPLTFDQDSLVRFQKWATYLTCETWNVDGSNYQFTTTVNSPFTNVPGIRGTLQIGDATYNQGTMAFFRGYSGTVPLRSKPPFGSTGGDLWDYEFNGNLNDSSGHNLTLSRTGTVSFSPAANYSPACILPPQTTFRAGTPVTMLTAANSFPLDGGETLTYVWQQIPSNLTGVAATFAQLSSQTAVNPTLQGLVAGSYTMQLTVTDPSGQHTTCSQKYGVVATDANGSVIISNPVHAQILGPLTASFASPWAAEPQQHTAYAQLMIQKLAGTSPYQFEFVDYWNQAQAGTVTVTNGSQAVVGVGTSFKSLFCNGGTTPANPASTSIVIWYPILPAYGLASGTTGRRMGAVQSCADDTHLTAQFTSDPTNNWITDTYIGAGSGLSYAYVEQNSAGAYGIVGWLTSAYPGNYYDNVKAFYALYYRTGIDDYLIAARTLADRFWSSPSIDKGIPYETSYHGNAWGSIAFQIRELSLTGLFMRNADNPPYNYDPGLRTIVDVLMGVGTPHGSSFATCPVGPIITTCGQDVREQGYALGWTALYALFGQDSSTVALAQTALTNDMNNRWGQCQANGGVCYNSDDILAFYAAWITGGTNFSASVTTNSYIVTANGSGTWNSSNFTSCSPTACNAANPPNAIWITSTGTTAPTSNAQGDGGWYYVVYHSPTQLYLTDITGQTTANYTGTSKSAAGWQTITFAQANNAGYLGFFWQPYMTGILNNAYWYVSLALASTDPTNAANAAIWALNNADAIATTGLNTTIQGGFVTKGPYYAIGITCPGGGPGVAYLALICDSGLLADRELNSETLNVATIAARFYPGSIVALTLGDTMMAAMYAQAGEPGFDGTNILGDLVNPGFFYTALTQHKWFGAFWGVGANWAWASVRVGGLRPPIPRVIQESVNLRTASQEVLTILSPDGMSSQVTCVSNPCPITIDAREGDYVVVSAKYLSGSGQVLFSEGQQRVLKVQ